MKKAPRRIRGAVGMGLTWGAAWFGAGMVMMLGILLVTGSTGADVPYPLGFGLFGFLAGVMFSAFLGIAEGRRSFDQMSMGRFAVWGAAGGLLLSTIFVVVVALVEDPGFLRNLTILGPVFATAGASCATGALALARRAEDRGSLGTGARVDAVGRSEDVQRTLHGGRD